jgi:hypothetical protein
MPYFKQTFENFRQFVLPDPCHSPWNCVNCIFIIQYIHIPRYSLSNEAIDDASAGTHTCEQFRAKLDKKLPKRLRLHYNTTEECEIPEEGKAVVKRNAKHCGYRIAWNAKHCGYRTA